MSSFPLEGDVPSVWIAVRKILCLEVAKARNGLYSQKVKLLRLLSGAVVLRYYATATSQSPRLLHVCRSYSHIV
jgi:hypothetical protein